MQSYVRSLIDPFNTDVLHPKFLDGSIDRTSGLRLRSTGTLTCSTSDFTYVVLFAGRSNDLAWHNDESDNIGTTTIGKYPDPFPLNVGNATDINAVNRTRVIGAAAKFSLLNGAEENDGYWEACRVTSVPLQAQAHSTPFFNRHWVLESDFIAACTDMANNPTYEQGRLKDLHNHMFKTNFRENELEWHLPGVVTEGHDMIIIRIRGRQVSGSPSVLMYDNAHLVEHEYKNTTPLYRLMTRNVAAPGHTELLSKLNFRKTTILASK